jgi:hypothetical protein
MRCLRSKVDRTDHCDHLASLMRQGTSAFVAIPFGSHAVDTASRSEGGLILPP